MARRYRRKYEREQKYVSTMTNSMLIRAMSGLCSFLTGIFWLLGDDVKKQFLFFFGVFMVNEIVRTLFELE